jgi:REP element-mobilizing transposase RayT
MSPNEKSESPRALNWLTYLLTFCCYGTHLPGSPGWVDRTRGDHRGGYGETSAALERHARAHMLHAPYTLNRRCACSVLDAMREVCAIRDWQLVAAHVRSTHLHCVVDGVKCPNRAIADLKAHASRALNRTEKHRKRWAREGSTRRLPNAAAVVAAVRYVVDGQGDAMAVYVSSPRRDGTGL